MPESAARRFAVVGAVEPLYNKNIIIWQITLHAITKETAQEAEASGLPVSAASWKPPGYRYLPRRNEQKKLLEAIRACRAEIAEADQKTRVFEDIDGEDEILAADELELGVYLDAAVTMAKIGPPADGAEPAEPSDSENDKETATDTDATEEDEEDRVIPMITKGLCKKLSQ